MRRETKGRIRISVLLLGYLAFIAALDIFAIDDLSSPVVLLVGIHFGLVLWVYYDAKKRGFDDPMTWYLAVALPVIGIFGVFAYLSHRKRMPEG